MQELGEKDRQINELIQTNRDLQNRLTATSNIEQITEPDLVILDLESQDLESQDLESQYLVIPELETHDLESQDPVKLSIVTESATSLNLSIEIK